MRHLDAARLNMAHNVRDLTLTSTMTVIVDSAGTPDGGGGTLPGSDSDGASYPCRIVAMSAAEIPEPDRLAGLTVFQVFLPDDFPGIASNKRVRIEGTIFKVRGSLMPRSAPVLNHILEVVRNG